MANDKKGSSLKVGDVVFLRGTIVQIGPNEMFANVAIQTMEPGAVKQNFHVHGPYLELQPAHQADAKPAPPASPPPAAIAPGPPKTNPPPPTPQSQPTAK